MSSVPQSLTLVLGDTLSLLLACALTLTLTRAMGWRSIDFPDTLVWGALWLVSRGYQGLYPGYGRSPQTELRLHVVGTLQVVGVQMASALAIQRFAPAAPSALVLWAILLGVALLMRYALRSLLIRMGQYGRPISVIGAGHTAELAIAHLCQHPAYGLNPAYAYDDNPELHGRHVRGIPVLGPIELALTAPRTQQALISIPGARADIQRWLVNSIYNAFPLTWVIPDLFGVPNQALHTHNIGTIASLEIRNNLRSSRARLTKRVFDLLGAGVGGLLISPIVCAIALAIRLDSAGPAVYRARRLGSGGHAFDCLKFRSMHSNAEAKLQEVLDADPVLKAEFAATHKLKDDPRVTRVGAFLRRTSLDELPQLLNVLRGEMSLVGPRPIVQAEIEKYGEAYATFKQVRPGMTGYWQANGRSDTSYDERVAMDQFYVTNWSPWLDLVVLLQTVRVVVKGRGAY
ncbi:undecaprenyl-phosphate galactose phosphotransferase WbaP [Deinococcus frigens]|uniref:undecaprenyl-phosphate galactose phosphotransferase WbaP n=1 Tax=Deinococcus frigens TaxID=249403 RepID=UPI000AC7D68E|nr:undecaprenyl-phosphate galactose phosphotransferase WbaP [Deinococcus frigens]